MASITNNNVFVLGSLFAFLATLNAFISFFTSLIFAFLSFFDRFLKAITASLTVTESGVMLLLATGRTIAAEIGFTKRLRRKNEKKCKVLFSYLNGFKVCLLFKHKNSPFYQELQNIVTNK